MSSIQIVSVVAVIAGSYFVGAIPFSLLVAKRYGVDLRKVGSGNIGSTNVSRVLGRRLGIFAFTLDVLKGLVPMLLAPRIWAAVDLGIGADASVGSTTLYWAWLGVAAACVFGHMFPIYLGFRGGKGVATSLGVLLGIWPYYTVPALICFALWGAVFLLGRYVSVASIVAAGLFPVAYYVIGLWQQWDPAGHKKPLLIFALVMATLVVYRHRSNIRRLLAGQEHRFGTSASGGSPKSPA